MSTSSVGVFGEPGHLAQFATTHLSHTFPPLSHTFPPLSYLLTASMPRHATNPQLYRWSFTFNETEGNKLPCHTAVVAALKKWGATKWIFQMEKGSTTGRRHYQGSMKLSVKKRKSWILNNSPVGKEGLSLSPTVNETGSFTYCMKEDTRVSGPWCDHVLYLKKDLACMQHPFPWQQKITEMVAAEPDDRTIHWIWEADGNVGKSKLVKWLDVMGMAVAVPFGTANQLKTNLIHEGPSRAYLLDFPRTRGKEEAIEAIYSTIEALKNGFLKSAMYGKKLRLVMEPPHVFVFSNTPPDQRALSRDRWVVKKVVDKELI